MFSIWNFPVAMISIPITKSTLDGSLASKHGTSSNSVLPIIKEIAYFRVIKLPAVPLATEIPTSDKFSDLAAAGEIAHISVPVSHIALNSPRQVLLVNVIFVIIFLTKVSYICDIIWFPIICPFTFGKKIYP